MRIKCSVVIPIYNRINQLLLTLTAFERQTFPRENFEVIVVEDGCPDRTKKLIRTYDPPYRFSIHSFPERRGPASARNAGLEKAKGSLIVFCDADFLVLPEFMETHYRYHCRYHNDVAVSGIPYCHHTAYTLYFPEFSDREKELIRLTLQKSGLWEDSYLQSTSPVEIITQEDLRKNFAQIKRVLGPNAISRKLHRELLKTDVAPWLLCVTRCLSVKKSILVEVGGFDERLARGEDWELGYRLSKAGLSFVSITKIVGYHQEHPHAFRETGVKPVPFHKLLYEKYGFADPELLLLSVWSSSDELWHDIPAYKNTLRLLRGKDYPSKKYRSMESVLIKATSKLATGLYS